MNFTSKKIRSIKMSNNDVQYIIDDLESRGYKIISGHIYTKYFCKTYSKFQFFTNRNQNLNTISRNFV